jgi:hypothetical protein
LDFFEGTTDLTERKNIVTEGKAGSGVAPVNIAARKA